MMNILVVEDDDFKFEKIEALIGETLDCCSVTRFDNVFETVRYLEENSPDKIVLDMSLPSHPAKVGEGSPISMPSGGIEIILELRYLKKRTIPIIVLTQYSQVEVENEYCSMVEAEIRIKELYKLENLMVQAYENDSDVWKEVTKEFLRA